MGCLSRLRQRRLRLPRPCAPHSCPPPRCRPAGAGGPRPGQRPQAAMLAEPRRPRWEATAWCLGLEPVVCTRDPVGKWCLSQPPCAQSAHRRNSTCSPPPTPASQGRAALSAGAVAASPSSKWRMANATHRVWTARSSHSSTYDRPSSCAQRLECQARAPPAWSTHAGYRRSSRTDPRASEQPLGPAGWTADPPVAAQVRRRGTSRPGLRPPMRARSPPPA
mmetsp:Transcript_57751/g.146537  ORF Transcript_57751/g.146537 Transcript_57751/m.146537 type:complete len:221 (+) Transcript_57751:452-1114(+)